MEKKEHIATEDLRELLVGNIPLYQQIIDARRERGEVISEDVLKLIDATASDGSNLIRASRDGVKVMNTTIESNKSATALNSGSPPSRYYSLDKRVDTGTVSHFLGSLDTSMPR